MYVPLHMRIDKNNPLERVLVVYALVATLLLLIWLFATLALFI